MSRDTGKVITVQGRLEPDELGITLPHEHLFVDQVDALYQKPDEAVRARLGEEDVKMENLWYLRRNPSKNKDNLIFDSIEDTIKEVSHFKYSGGNSIVDVTAKGMGADPKSARSVANATDLNIIKGTSYYTADSQPDSLNGMGIDDITSEFISDVRNGIDETRVRAGMIGEIGLSGHIHPDEEKVLRAGARAAIRTGAPLSIHPPGRTPHSQKDRTYPSSRWGLEILDIIEEEGLPPERVVICHMDRTLYEDIEYQKALAERGAYVEYDLWGKQNYYNDYNDGYPSDPDRVDNVVELIESGYVSQLLFSHDIAYKMWRRNYGGFGYAHILENVVPMLEHASVSMEQIRTIIEHNPQRMLTFSDPVE